MLRARFASSVLLVTLVVGVREARSQEAAALAARRGLIEDAERARTGGDHARALDLAQRAAVIQMSTTLRLFLAQEQNAVGRLAEAYGNADTCVREAQNSTTIRNQRQVLTTCQALVDLLRPRIGRITVQPRPTPPGLRVSVNGTALDAVFYGVPYVVTPGPLVVEASAPGFEPLRRELPLGEGASIDVPLALVAIPQTPGNGDPGPSNPPTPDAGVRQPPPPEEEHNPPPVEEPRPRGPGAGPWVLVGSGAAIALVSIPFFVLRDGEAARCTRSMSGELSCPEQAIVDRGNTYQALAFASIGVGSAVLAGGVIWLVVGQVSAGSARRSALWAPTFQATAGGGVLGAHFQF